jgi:purine-cytosine permease-like protein
VPFLLTLSHEFLPQHLIIFILLACVLLMTISGNKMLIKLRKDSIKGLVY